jgi:hypothetical protein
MPDWYFGRSELNQLPPGKNDVAKYSDGKFDGIPSSLIG